MSVRKNQGVRYQINGERCGCYNERKTLSKLSVVGDKKGEKGRIAVVEKWVQKGWGTKKTWKNSAQHQRESTVAKKGDKQVNGERVARLANKVG